MATDQSKIKDSVHVAVNTPAVLGPDGELDPDYDQSGLEDVKGPDDSPEGDWPVEDRAKAKDRFDVAEGEVKGPDPAQWPADDRE